MPRHRRRDPMFRYRRHGEEIIVLAVRWYISYRLSLRDLAEMLAERGLNVYPSTIWRWVQRFVPEFEKRWDRLRKPVGCSWRVDETYVQIRRRWCYLYRAVDKQGRTVDFLLRRDRGIAAAQAFFRKALYTNGGRRPRTITLDATSRAAEHCGYCAGRTCSGDTSRCAPPSTSTTSSSRTIGRSNDDARPCTA